MTVSSPTAIEIRCALPLAILSAAVWWCCDLSQEVTRDGVSAYGYANWALALSVVGGTAVSVVLYALQVRRLAGSADDGVTVAYFVLALLVTYWITWNMHRRQIHVDEQGFAVAASTLYGLGNANESNVAFDDVFGILIREEMQQNGFAKRGRLVAKVYRLGEEPASIVLEDSVSCRAFAHILSEVEARGIPVEKPESFDIQY